MLDDLFEKSKHNRRSDHYGRDQYHNRYGDERHVHYNPLLDMAKKLLRNKAILAGIVLTILIIGAVGIWLITAMLPYLGQVIFMAYTQGINGILEAITPLLQKIWRVQGNSPMICGIFLLEATGHTLRKEAEGVALVCFNQ